jgi:hypothetical protein
MIAKRLQQPNTQKPQESPVSNTLENKADLVRLFELLAKIDRRVNATGSYETQNNGNPNNTNQAC